MTMGRVTIRLQNEFERRPDRYTIIGWHSDDHSSVIMTAGSDDDVAALIADLHEADRAYHQFKVFDLSTFEERTITYALPA